MKSILRARVVGFAPTLALILFLSMVLLGAGCASVPTSCSELPKSPNGPTAPPPTAQSITVSVSPASLSVQAGQTQTFTATVNNDSKNNGVAWALSGPGCNGGMCGVLSATSSASGAAITYTAPATRPSPANVSLTATSVSDRTKSASAAISITATPAPLSVSISPTTATVPATGSQNFTALLQNDPQNKGVNWTLSGAGCRGAACGTLSSTSSASGAAITYTAPAAVPNPATVTLTATAVSDHNGSAAASITITAPGPPLIVSVSPQSQTVMVNQSQSFTATVKNDVQNKGVNWTLSGAGCSGAACGTLSSTSSASGAAITYTAPAAVPNPATVTLTATSVSANSASAAATITIQTTLPPLTVSVSPQTQTVAAGNTQNFTATVQNDPENNGVTWKLSGTGCSGAACGTLSSTSSASGTPITYTAPTDGSQPSDGDVDGHFGQHQ